MILKSYKGHCMIEVPKDKYEDKRIKRGLSICIVRFGGKKRDDLETANSVFFEVYAKPKKIAALRV